MGALLITNIGILAGLGDHKAPLRGRQLSDLQTISDAYLLIEDEHIASFGPMSDVAALPKPSTVLDARGGILLPAWCDSHTHLVFAGSREQEFVEKIRGRTYAEIAAAGGGILQSARQVNESTEEQLFAQAYARLQQAIRLGTGSIEIKSGYGLTLDGELKMLRVIRRLKQVTRINVRATFLGAHAFPAEFRDDHAGYVNLLIEQMLPAVAAEQLADYVDVFCEQGFFSIGDMQRICVAAKGFGLRPRIHANQLSASGAVEAAISLGAISVDHLELLNESDITALGSAGTMATLLPSAAFFLRMPYAPARKLIERNSAIALASDCNPGSSPGLNMNFVVALACIGMKMLPEEAINAATFNGACAMDCQHVTGSVAIGKHADLILTRAVPSLAYLPYAFSENLIAQVFIKGECIH